MEYYLVDGTKVILENDGNVIEQGAEINETIKLYEEEMRKLINKSECDIEAAHEEADAILCEILKSLGFDKIVELYQEVEKLHA